MRGERDVREFQLEIHIDSREEIGSAVSHVRWPFVGAMKSWVVPLFNHSGRPFLVSFPADSLELLSHQG